MEKPSQRDRMDAEAFVPAMSDDPASLAHACWLARLHLDAGCRWLNSDPPLIEKASWSLSVASAICRSALLGKSRTTEEPALLALMTSLEGAGPGAHLNVRRDHIGRALAALTAGLSK